MITKGLGGNVLKVIAIIAMTIDHLAWVETYQLAEPPMQIGLHCIVYYHYPATWPLSVCWQESFRI